MGYHCIVCVKQVPDTARVTGDAMKEDGTLNRAALPAIFNPEDINALEAALQIRDSYGGRVTVLTMGPLGAAEVLRECLCRGADRGILINDRRAAGSDTLATSYILSRAIKTIGQYDFVLCGRQAIDGDTAQVGPQLAEKLGVAQVTYFERFVEWSDGSARVRRNVGNGWEVIEAKLPLLMTVLDIANEPRPASARRVMRYKRARTVGEVENEVAKALPEASEDDRNAEQANMQWCGISGSPTKVHRVQSVVLTKEGYTQVPPSEEGIRGMVHELIVDHTLG